MVKTIHAHTFSIYCKPQKLLNEEQTLQDLIERVQSGDRKALEELAKLWHPNVYRYALRFTGKVEMAKEVSQLTFVSITKNIMGLRESSSFIPWVFRIAANECRNLLRKQKFHEPLEVIYSHRTSERNALEILERQEAIERVKKALLTIPEEQREVIILKEYEGLKFREIAKILDTSENTVKSRMYYGLSALKKNLMLTKNTKKGIQYEAK